MSQVRGITDLGIFPVLGQPNLNIKVDRAKAARYGLNSGDVNTVVQAAMGGAVATTVLEGDRQFDLVVRYTPEYRDSIEKIRNIKVGYQTSQRRQCLYTLERTGDDHAGHRSGLDLSRERAALHPGQVQRPRPRPGRHGGGGAGAHREKRETSAGYRLIWAGEFGDLQEAKKRLEIIVPISLVLIVGLLYSLFNNFRDCLLALAGIPFAIVGRHAGALYLRPQFQHLRRHRLRLAVWRVHHGRHPDDYFYNQERHHGFDARGRDVPRCLHPHAPLLMTALSACIGLLPAAISTGIGSQVQRPLATVIVGGMLVGPVMLLLAVPALRMIFLGRDNNPPLGAPLGESK
jgi:cobalt-zinc-cadmium resistance protein CzcA